MSRHLKLIFTRRCFHPYVSKLLFKNKRKVELEADYEKELGNIAYRRRDFQAALQHYDKAIESDPTNIIYRSNRAAVFLEQGDCNRCISECENAVEIGRSYRADFKHIAKILARIGNAYYRLNNLELCLKYYYKSLSEYRDPDVVRRSHEVERIVKEQERLAYINPTISLQEKNIGNEYFKNGDFPTALVHYTEAIRRNPNDALLYSNRAACYTKLLEFHLAVQDCDECIRLNPEFVKGYLRKGACLLAIKDCTRAAESYLKALDIDPDCNEALEGYKSCLKQECNDPEAVRRRAMQDPEVQKILSDPAMQLILQQMQKDPAAVHEHLQNREVSRKIEKLLEFGLITIR